MAIIKTLERAPSLKTWCTLALSTNADGVTGSDIADLGGMSLCGMALSSGSTDANYSFKGSIDQSTNLQTLLSTTGGILAFGSTVAGAMNGRTMIFDPSIFAGIRFLQVVSGTTVAPIAGSSGSTVQLFAATIGPNR